MSTFIEVFSMFLKYWKAGKIATINNSRSKYPRLCAMYVYKVIGIENGAVLSEKGTLLPGVYILI